MKEILEYTAFYHIKTIPVLLSLQGPITWVVISKIDRVESLDVLLWIGKLMNVIYTEASQKSDRTI